MYSGEKSVMLGGIASCREGLGGGVVVVGTDGLMGGSSNRGLVFIFVQPSFKRQSQRSQSGIRRLDV